MPLRLLFHAPDSFSVSAVVALSLQSTMLQAIERYMKQAIVDKVPSVSSSALVSSLVGTPCGVGLRDSLTGKWWSVVGLHILGVSHGSCPLVEDT